ncbi:MAG: hypothetical protein LBE47_00515 [Methanomassiliicoccaceae archaeon]|jgi:hypothetical protein|nr:hypothetical protein [Methanomassiliicoccaceae archaeon]
MIMKLNGKGEGGFMESVIAVMVVVITLTAFLSFLAFFTSHNNDKDIDIPATDIFDHVSIVNGSIEADIYDIMTEMIERYGYRGMRVTLSTSGIYDSSLTMNAGTNDSDIILSKNGTIVVRSDDGRSVPVNYSMAVWI